MKTHGRSKPYRVDPLKKCLKTKTREMHPEGCTCYLDQENRVQAFWDLIMRSQKVEEKK